MFCHPPVEVASHCQTPLADINPHFYLNDIYRHFTQFIDKISFMVRSLSVSLPLWLESKRCFSPVFRPYNLSGHGIFQALEISRPWKFPWGTSRFSPWKFPGPGNIHGVGHGNFHGRKCCNFVPWRDSSLQMQNFQLSV